MEECEGWALVSPRRDISKKPRNVTVAPDFKKHEDAKAKPRVENNFRHCDKKEHDCYEHFA